MHFWKTDFLDTVCNCWTHFDNNHFPFFFNKLAFAHNFHSRALYMYFSVPPLLPPPLLPMCLVLALWPPGARCCPLLWLREEEFGLEMVLSSCSMEHRSAMRASRSTVSPWFNASAEWQDKATRGHAGRWINNSLFILNLWCYTGLARVINLSKVSPFMLYIEKR